MVSTSSFASNCMLSFQDDWEDLVLLDVDNFLCFPLTWPFPLSVDWLWELLVKSSWSLLPFEGDSLLAWLVEPISWCTSCYVAPLANLTVAEWDWLCNGTDLVEGFTWEVPTTGGGWEGWFNPIVEGFTCEVPTREGGWQGRIDPIADGWKGQNFIVDGRIKGCVAPFGEVGIRTGCNAAMEAVGCSGRDGWDAKSKNNAHTIVRQITEY